MSDVEFEENNLVPRRPAVYQEQKKRSSFAGLFIKMGWAKDENGASKVMLTLTVIFFIITVYLLYHFL